MKDSSKKKKNDHPAHNKLSLDTLVRSGLLLFATLPLSNSFLPKLTLPPSLFPSLSQIEFRQDSHLGRRVPIGALYSSILAIGISFETARHAAASQSSSSSSSSASDSAGGEDPHLCVQCSTMEDAEALLAMNETEGEFGRVYATRERLRYQVSFVGLGLKGGRGGSARGPNALRFCRFVHRTTFLRFWSS